MQRWRRVDSAAVTSTVGVVLLIGIMLVLAALAAILYHRFQAGQHPALDSSARAAFTSSGYIVSLAGPDPIPVSPGAHFIVRVDGSDTTVPLSAIASQLPDPTLWRVGDPVCVVGPSGCALTAGSAVGVTLVVGNAKVFELPPLQYVVAGSSYLVKPDGHIGVTCQMPVTLRVVGTSITDGPSGPEIPVTVALTTNGQAPFTPLFGGQPVNGGEVYDLHTVGAGSVLGVQGSANLGSFHATFDSVSNDPHVLVLRDGAHAPDFAPYAGQAPLDSFLQPYVNTATQTMTLGPNEVIVLFEFSSPPDSSNSAADFQDLVVLFQFGTLTC
jgi:hypothetical protein